VFGGKSLLKWFAQLKTLPKLWVRTTEKLERKLWGLHCEYLKGQTPFKKGEI